MNAVSKIKGLFSTGRGYPSLKKAIESGAGSQARALLKHLNECGISCWSDITRGRLYELRDHLERTVAPSSVKTYLAALRAVLNRWAEDVPMKCGDFGDAMRARGDRPVRVYLTPEELVTWRRIRGEPEMPREESSVREEGEAARGRLYDAQAKNLTGQAR